MFADELSSPPPVVGNDEDGSGERGLSTGSARAWEKAFAAE
jgi:hypothetical protein